MALASLLRQSGCTRHSSLLRSWPAAFSSPVRSYSLPAAQRPLAFAFDIDGVLKAGPLVLPEAKRALQILDGRNPRNEKVPYVFITNGGGKDEASRAADLSRELEIDLKPSQIIQAHTVMKSLVPLYANKPILMVGGPESPPGVPRRVMHQYGFNNVFTTHDLHAYAPAAWPFTKVAPEQLPHIRKEDFSKIQFAAVLVFHDSREWGRDIQLIIDVLRSNNGVFGTEHSHDTPPKEQMPIYFSHGDLLWGNDHSVVRFGQGAFRLALENVWKHTTGRDLQATVFGKPHSLTYDYATELLRDLLIQTAGSSKSASQQQRAQAAQELGPSVWMVGDNPESDIAGANNYGWSSALVRTGVYKDAHGTPRHEPTVIVDDVEQAVKKALELEWGI
ncbi:uncharacterized protein PFL1_04635 [Pseudozyma flocculosa PF-1]|uniref:Related to cat eye syndrome critical region protein 5 n=2 Tax=Pseudozyma flocculosa TaxID=84751 RepID=A0A5C3FBC1_9BASI|nr:uncharacterized protein PFL1_04635 [Pseudozyma flocculosa PF-1]EPQ27891.1 hypothetical protein PFL1_04635 [Pseudozyma flocculosa PF-1]SPO41672.1 related to cat eye syndrome critical region protein 5 precursor [Pseudozyma flocculosa]